MQSDPASPTTQKKVASDKQRSLDGSLIQARNLSFAYSSLPVVVEVSLALPRGATGALIGANGSGKSTLIRLFAGLLKPDTGRVLFNGAPLEELQVRERAKRIAYVPQSTSAVFRFTALELVLTGRSPYSGRFRFESAHDEQIALAALAALGVAHLSARHITELSGGERQLVTVARALAQQPEVMLLDEPASALDLKHRTQLARALRQLSHERAITVLMVTHDLMSLDSAADLVFAMKCGRVVADGPPEVVLHDGVLGDVYDAPVRTMRTNGHTFVWSEL